MYCNTVLANPLTEIKLLEGCAMSDGPRRGLVTTAVVTQLPTPPSTTADSAQLLCDVREENVSLSFINILIKLKYSHV